MKLIARTDGPIVYDSGKTSGSITTGNEYEVVNAHYWTGIRWIRKPLLYNPKGAKFYVDVVDNYGNICTYWNDYFLSTPEAREVKLNQIL